MSGGAARDVVGHLLAANDQWYVVLPEDRGPVWVPRGEAEAVRQVPPRTVLATSRPADIERVLERSTRSGRRARLGGWQLGDGRALALGDPGVPLDRALAAVTGWCGGPAVIRALPGDLAEALQGLGCGLSHAALVLTAASPSARVPTAVPLTRGWALEVPADDGEGHAAALGAGYVERYRAVTLTLG
ncbi:hypothetical protein [Tessaracoccus sp. G1721]